jgi:hypothetical protein
MPPGVKKEPAVVQWLRQTGLVKTKRQAEMVLLIVSVLLIATSVLFIMRTGKEEIAIPLDSSIDPETYLPYGVTPPQ